MTDPEVMLQPHVWVMAPEGDDTAGWHFPWAWSRWRPEPALIPTTDTRTASNLGTASFTILRRRRLDPSGFGANRFRFQGYTPVFRSGCWIAITQGPGVRDDPTRPGGRFQQMDPTKVLWWGQLTTISQAPILGVDDERTGTAEAQEIGHLLDAQRVAGAGEHDPASGRIARQLRSAPTANLAAQGSGGDIVGNAVATTTSDGTRSVYGFAPTAALCGTNDDQLWTRWRLLRHLHLVARPLGLPVIDLADGLSEDPAGGTGTPDAYLNDRSVPEVLEIWSQTYRGAFDLLVPESHHLQWRIDLPTTGDLDRWLFRVDTTCGDAGYGLSVQTPTNVDFSSARDETFQVVDSSGDQPDEVAVQGGRIRFLVSVSFQDDNFGAGYSSTQLSAYNAAPQKERTQPQHRDVFARFVLVPDSGNRLRVVLTPGLGSGGSYPMTPYVVWTGSAVVLSDGTGGHPDLNYSPYLPTLALPSDLPWPVGLKGDGTDTRDAAAKARPTWLEPRLFHRDGDTWTDLLADNSVISENPALSMEDRGGALRIEYKIRHALGDGTFAGSEDGGEPGTIDWRDLIVTLAVDSDQTVYVARARPAVGTATDQARFGRMRRRLLVDDERLQCWIALKGSVLGVTDDDEAARITVTNESSGHGYVIRNDWKAAQRYCDRLAAWAFRSRLSGVITLIRPDDPPAWARPGALIGTVEDHASESIWTLNTAVRSITRTWGDRPRLTITTDLPPAPAAAAMRPSPIAGGATSPSLGGTVPSMVQKLQHQVNELRDRTKIRQVIPPRGGSVTPLTKVLLDRGNTLLSSPVTILGAKVNFSALTEVPAAAPTFGSTYADGLAYGRVIAADGTAPTPYVWICNRSITVDGTTVAGGLSTAAPGDNEYWVKNIIQVPITGGGGATAAVYQIYRV